jgi:toxin CcdB
MAHFDVYRNARSKRLPFVVDVQANFLSRLTTRVVIPLTPLGSYGARPITRLHPVLTVDEVPHVLLTNELAAVPASSLRTPFASLRNERATVIRALDLLFTGS